MNLKALMTSALIKAIKNGQIFSVTFRKKDNSIRTLVGRKGVKKHLRGGESKIKKHENLVSVYDLQAKGYRSFDVNRVISLRAGGVEYSIRG